MFIKEVQKKLKSKRKGKNKKYNYTQHRLVESIRTLNGPRQHVVLNLGTLNVSNDKFKTLANLIERFVNKDPQRQLFEEDPELTRLAKHYADIIINKRLVNKKESGTDDIIKEQSKCFETIDVNSATTMTAKTVGAEHIALTQLKELSFDKILEECGFNKAQTEYAMAQVCARLVHPSSERETARWLRETSGLDELLRTDFSKITDFPLHQTADLLLKHKDELEQRLAEKSRDLFSLKETLILYDLTNTYFESSKPNSKIAAFGKSKEKRTDCPLLTLALVVDEQGFPKRSKIFEGNVSEPKTLWQILEKLGLEKKNDGDSSSKKTVVIDAGIATEENLRRIREDKRFDYVAISRKKKFDRQMFSDADAKDIELNRNMLLTIKSAKCGDELFLLCQSPDRLAKEEAIYNRRKKKFEEGLLSIKKGLEKPRTCKKYAKILERVGRLKECYKVGHFYKIDVTEKEGKALDVTWKFNKEKKSEPGEYLLRTSRLDLLDEEISKIHRTLTIIELAFRWLKSSLGLRPNFHQLDKRMEAHAFVSVLAYYVLAPILNKLDCGGQFISYSFLSDEKHDWELPYGWHSVVRALSTQIRVTSSYLCEDDKRIDIRTTVEPTANQVDIYRRLKMSPCPLRRVVSKSEEDGDTLKM
jgi:hypothetical protein